MNNDDIAQTVMWSIIVASAIVLPCYARIKLGRGRTSRIVSFLMRARLSSWAIGIAYVICGCGLWYVSGEFFKMFIAMLGCEASLPTLIRFLITTHPFLWCGMIAVGIIIVLKDFLSPAAKKLPNWPLAVVLVLVVLLTMFALFQPMVRLGEGLGS